MSEFKFTERPNSRKTTDTPPTFEFIYRASGTGNNDNVYVHLFALSATPAVVALANGAIVYRQDIQIQSEGWDVWTVTVPYAEKGDKPPTGQWTFNFDTTGGSFHIKASKETVASYGTTPPDYKQLIGVNGDDVEGADIVIPALKINVTYSHPLGVVTIAYAKALARLTGKANSTTFLTFDPGEVLYLGSTGSDGSEAAAEVGYQFACSENLQNQIVGAITVIEKDGWDLAWIKWKDDVDGDLPVKVPEFVYVERVYERVNLVAALGFGG